MHIRNAGQERIRDLFTSGKRFNLVYGGSRSGKTYEIVGTIIERALHSPNSRHLICRQEGTSAKRAIVKGTWKELERQRFEGKLGEWKEQYGYFLLPNGSEVWISGLNDEKAMEKVLGNEYATIYINEASEVRYSAFTLLRTRLAQTVKTISNTDLSQRFYVDLNPTNRLHWTYRLWIDGVDPDGELPVDQSKYGSCVVNPKDNAENLSDEYLEDLENAPAAAKRRFFDGEYSADNADALWRRKSILRTQSAPDLVRIVVALDPAVSNEIGSDETGIICAGIDAGGNGYVLADDSGKYSPQDWARRAVSLYDQFQADRIVAEVNQGGDLVVSTLRVVRQEIPTQKVRASRGKYTRAEPVAALYERGKIFHVGEFDKLEEQMCSFTSDFNRKAQGYSPDRVDALVWAFTHLFNGFNQTAKKDTSQYLATAHTYFK